MKSYLLSFLEKQKLLTISTLDEEGKPWLCNLYFGVDKDLNLFWVSSRKTKHSIHIEKNGSVAFTVSWFNESDIEDIISIQGTGVAKRVTNIKEIIGGVNAFCTKFPAWREWFDKEMLKNLVDDKLYMIKPTYMKFRSDKKLGKDVFEEFFLQKQT